MLSTKKQETSDCRLKIPEEPLLVLRVFWRLSMVALGSIHHAIIGIPSIDLRDRHARILMAKLLVISSTLERSSFLTLLVLSSTFRHGRLFLATPWFRTQ